MFTQPASQTIAVPEALLSMAPQTSVHNRMAANLRRCTIRKDRASRLHYDLRLDFEGFPIGFAILRGPSYVAGVPRAAVHVTEHGHEYTTSERVIPEGGHGASPVMLWDEGFWIPLPGYEDIPKSLRNGFLRFTFECHKLKGNWMLRRHAEASRGGRRELWELIKEADSFARPESAPDILIEAPYSVSTGGTIEEIEHGGPSGPNRKPAFDQIKLIFTFEP